MSLSYIIDNLREEIGSKGTLKIMQIRSKKCTMPRSPGKTCTFCNDLLQSEEIRKIIEMATKNILPQAMNLSQLNYVQTRQVLDKKNADQAALRSKKQKLELKQAQLVSRLDDYDQFLHMAALNDVNGLSRLIRVALRNNASPKQLVECLERAIQGLYHVKSYQVRTSVQIISNSYLT